MLSFTILTDTPARLRNFLISRDVMKLVDDGAGGQVLVGTNPGMEWVEIPNAIVTDPGSGVPGEPGYVPPTYDNRRAYMVKFAHQSEANEVDGPTVDAEGNRIPAWDWSKFAKWVKANSSVVAAPAGWTIHGQPVGNVRKINGENVWLAHEAPERFGVWQ